MGQKGTQLVEFLMYRVEFKQLLPQIHIHLYECRNHIDNLTRLLQV